MVSFEHAIIEWGKLVNLEWFESSKLYLADFLNWVETLRNRKYLKFYDHTKHPYVYRA